MQRMILTVCFTSNASLNALQGLRTREEHSATGLAHLRFALNDPGESNLKVHFMAASTAELKDGVDLNSFALSELIDYLDRELTKKGAEARLPHRNLIAGVLTQLAHNAFEEHQSGLMEGAAPQGNGVESPPDKPAEELTGADVAAPGDNITMREANECAQEQNRRFGQPHHGHTDREGQTEAAPDGNDAGSESRGNSVN